MYFQIMLIQNVCTLPQSTLWGGCAARLALLASLRGGSGGGHARPSWQPAAGTQSHDVQIMQTLMDKVAKLKFDVHHKFFKNLKIYI